MILQTEQDLAEAIAGAAGPLRIYGGGTRPVGVPVAGAPVSVAGLSGITLYEPGALTMVAKAGTPLAEIEAALAHESQRLAFEPMDHRTLLGTSGTPTIGGVVAGNISGPRRIAVGACRDHALGVRFIDGTGTIIKNGGRVMKNVTGYDLVKLLTGSFGTLGVLSEVSLKVLPTPAFETTLVLHGLALKDAVAAMAAAAGSPFEVTGLAHVPRPAGDTPTTLIRLEGFETSVRYRARALQTQFSSLGEITTAEGQASADLWRDIRDVKPFAAQDERNAGDVWRVSVKPSDAPELVERMGADCAVLLDWAGGLIWAMAPQGVDLRGRLGLFSGHATLIRASLETRAKITPFQPENPVVTALSKGLRDKFDPRGILNAGLMG